MLQSVASLEGSELLLYASAWDGHWVCNDESDAINTSPPETHRLRRRQKHNKVDMPSGRALDKDKQSRPWDLCLGGPGVGWR